MRTIWKLAALLAIAAFLKPRPGGGGPGSTDIDPATTRTRVTDGPDITVNGVTSANAANKATLAQGQAGGSSPGRSPNPDKGPVPGQARTEAQEYANMQRRPPGPDTPKTVAVMIDPHGNPVYGESGGTGPGQHDPAVQEALDNVPPSSREPWHGECAEITALDRFRPSRNPVAGSTISAARVRGPLSAQHGSAIPPCSSCSSVLDQLGITDES